MNNPNHEVIAQNTGTPISNATGILSTLPIINTIGKPLDSVANMVNDQVGPQADKGNAPKINQVVDEAAANTDRTQRGYDLAALSGGTGTLQDARNFAKSAGLTDQAVDGLMTYLNSNLDSLPKFSVATAFGDIMTVAMAALLKESFGGADFDPMPGIQRVFSSIKQMEDLSQGRLDTIGIVSRALRSKTNPLTGGSWDQDLASDQITNHFMGGTPFSQMQNLSSIITSLMNPNRPTKALLEFALKERNQTHQQAISTMMDVAALKAERDIRYSRKLREFWQYMQNEIPGLARSPLGQKLLNMLDLASISLAKVGAWQDAIGLGGGASPLHVNRAPANPVHASMADKFERYAQSSSSASPTSTGAVPTVSGAPSGASLPSVAPSTNFTSSDPFVQKMIDRSRGVATPRLNDMNTASQQQKIEAGARIQDLEVRLGVMGNKDGILNNIENDFASLAKIGQTGNNVNLGFGASGATASGNLVYVAAAQRLVSKIQQAETLLDQYASAIDQYYSLVGQSVNWSDSNATKMAQLFVVGEMTRYSQTIPDRSNPNTPANTNAVALRGIGVEDAKNIVRQWKFTLGVMTTMVADYALIEKNMAWIAQQQLVLQKNKSVASTLTSLGYPQGAMFGPAVTNVYDANGGVLIKAGDPMPSQAITDVTERFKARYKTIESELQSALQRAKSQAQSLASSGSTNAGQLADMMVQHLQQRVELAQVAYAGAVQEQAEPTGKAMQEVFQKHSSQDDWMRKIASESGMDKIIEGEDTPTEDDEVDATTVPELYNSLIPGYGTMMEKSPATRNMTLNQVRRRFRRKPRRLTQ
jgi:hypothetical protein